MPEHSKTKILKERLREMHQQWKESGKNSVIHQKLADMARNTNRMISSRDLVVQDRVLSSQQEDQQIRLYSLKRDSTA